MANTDQIENLVRSVLDDMQVDLVDLQFHRGKRSALKIFVWEKGGIGLDRCTEISRKISDLLDQQDIISSAYRLEVSSPGLDRPLKSSRDFERNIGYKVKVHTAEEKPREITGRIKQVSENAVILETDSGEMEFDLNQIATAKVMVEF